MTLEKGDLLNNRYQILDILGRGGMGSVYHAIDKSLGVEVAVKENLFVTEDYEKQFRLEAVILASLRHANLPRVTDHFTIDGQGQYLVMDYIEGRDLRHIMETGPLPEEEAVRIGIAVCDALTYLHTHKRPVLHRDIKPGNVRISADGHVYLVDFGLAKMSNLDEHTLSGARAMTPGYSPPEQYGTSRTDARTDVYSLGATLYAALTGFIPEDGLARVVDEVKLTPLRKRNPKVSVQVAGVIEKAMEPHPNNRYQSAEEFERALRGMEPVKSEELPPSESSDLSEPVPATNIEKVPTQRPVKRRASSIGWILLLAILGASALGANWIISNPQSAPESLQGLLAMVISPTPTIATTLTLPPTPKSLKTPASTSTKNAALITTTPTQPLKTSTPSTIPTETIPPAPLATAIGGGVGEIAFASIHDNTSQIYLVNTDGSNLQPLTNEINGACQPTWSPDGENLIYVSPCAAKSDQYPQSSLFMLNIDKNQITQVLPTSGGDFEPAWSPDGTKIAFSSLREGFLAIYVFKFDDKTITRLTDLSSTIQSRQPAWSPDGSKIVYTVKRNSILRIWGMSADGSNQAQLFRTGGGTSDYLPIWSPDSSHILFSESNSQITSPSSLMRFAVNSEQAPQIISVPLPIVDVDFSADGNWIAYETSDTKKQDIYIYHLFNGGPPQPLTNDSIVDFDPAWRPAPKP